MTLMKQWRRHAGIGLTLAIIAGVVYLLMSYNPQRVTGAR